MTPNAEQAGVRLRGVERAAATLDANRHSNLKRGSQEAVLRTIKLETTALAVTVLALVTTANAQQSKAQLPAAAPVPSQIASAQKIFVSNGGGDSPTPGINEAVFNGGPDRPYNQFYEAIKGWGRYEVVSSPADADLVFEISWSLADTEFRLPVFGKLRLVILDPRTHTTLWTISEYAQGAMLVSNRDKNLDQAMTTVIGRLKVLATSAPPGVVAPN